MGSRTLTPVVLHPGSPGIPCPMECLPYVLGTGPPDCGQDGTRNRQACSIRNPRRSERGRVSGRRWRGPRGAGRGALVGELRNRPDGRRPAGSVGWRSGAWRPGTPVRPATRRR